MMVINNETTTCARCGKIPAVIFCDGCQIPLCIDCRKFDLWGYGCGHVDTKVFCHACYDDITINPYGGTLNEGSEEKTTEERDDER
ncbi:MAG: B-box zinc finger protein [Syntrophaceae bacterium]